jgi:hypothetical protein
MRIFSAARVGSWSGLAALGLGATLALAAAGARAEPKFTQREYSPSADAPAPQPAPQPAALPAPPPKPTAAVPATPVYQQDSELGSHEIRLLPGGTELEFTGALTSTAVLELDQMLTRNAGIRVLQLTSEGGLGGPSLLLADKLRARHITTYVPTYCASACTFLFIAGTQRYVAPQARLGFHAASSVHGTGKDDPKYNAEIGRWMVAQGVTADFAEKAVSVPHDGMWQPDTATLMKAGVVTGVGRPGQFAQPSFGQDASVALDKTILNQPLYIALRKADPKAYEAARGELLLQIQKTSDASEAAAFGSIYFTRAFDRAAATASDQSLVDLVTAMTEEMELINVKSGRLCMLVATGRPYPTMEVRRILPDYLVQKKIMAATAVLESSATAPQPAPSRDRVKQAFDNLMIRMVNTLRDEFQYLVHPDLDPGRACFMFNEIYKEALQSDPEDRSVLLRGLIGNLL